MSDVSSLDLIGMFGEPRGDGCCQAASGQHVPAAAASRRPSEITGVAVESVWINTMWIRISLDNGLLWCTLWYVVVMDLSKHSLLHIRLVRDLLLGCCRKWWKHNLDKGHRHRFTLGHAQHRKAAMKLRLAQVAEASRLNWRMLALQHLEHNEVLLRNRMYPSTNET